MRLIAVILLLALSTYGAVPPGGSGGSRRLISGKSPVQFGGGGGGGTPNFVEFQSSAGSASASSQTISITVASGNAIVVGTKWEDANRTVTVSDGSNTYTPLGKTNAGPDQAWVQMFYAQNVTGGALTITVSYGATTAFVRAGAYELSGCSTSAALDQSAVPGSDAIGPGDPVPTVTGDVTTTQANEVLITFGANYVGALSGTQTDWTKSIDVTAFDAQYRVVSSAGTYHGEHNSVTSGGAEVAVMATFK